jgi:hypothetical protein
MQKWIKRQIIQQWKKALNDAKMPDNEKLKNVTSNISVNI